MRNIILCVILAAAGCGNDTPTQPQRRILAFTAVWCGPCKRNEPQLVTLEQQGVQITRINIDSQPALAQQYKVKSVPTYVVMDGEKESERTQDVRRLFKLLRWLRRL